LCRGVRRDARNDEVGDVLLVKARVFARVPPHVGADNRVEGLAVADNRVQGLGVGSRSSNGSGHQSPGLRVEQSNEKKEGGTYAVT